eukprot:COSAG01_NODE_868_length_13035_cov_4.786024_10_plen_107_part_00
MGRCVQQRPDRIPNHGTDLGVATDQNFGFGVQGLDLRCERNFELLEVMPGRIAHTKLPSKPNDSELCLSSIFGSRVQPRVIPEEVGACARCHLVRRVARQGDRWIT